MNRYTAPLDFTFGTPQRRGATTFAAVPNATARVPIVPRGNQEQGRSQKFILGGYNFTARYYSPITSSLTTSAAMSAQNNFQGLILGGYIYRYTPPVATPLIVSQVFLGRIAVLYT